jgi:hypothetical protein
MAEVREIWVYWVFLLSSYVGLLKKREIINEKKLPCSRIKFLVCHVTYTQITICLWGPRKILFLNRFIKSSVVIN